MARLIRLIKWKLGIGWKCIMIHYFGQLEPYILDGKEIVEERYYASREGERRIIRYVKK